MSYVVGFKCVECSREHQPGAVQYVCPACGGNLDVIYDYRRIAGKLSPSTLAVNRDRTIWRYRALLPIEEDSAVPPIPVGWTPIHECRRLASEYGVGRLHLKDDGRNPTGSFKDRPSALAVVKAMEGGARVVTTASSGNAGVALAGMCASMQIESVIFVPASAPPAKLTQLQIYGAGLVLVEASYDEAYDLCLEAAQRYGWYQRSTGYNPFMTEGKKTAALEIAEQLDWVLPDKVFVAVGDGCIIGGLWKGLKDLRALGFVDRVPQLIGVQAKGSAVIADAVNGDGIVRPRDAKTIADSICVGKPRDATKAVRAMRESGGQCITVSDTQIVAAIVHLAQATGVFAEPAAAAAFAGFLALCERGGITSGERVLIMLTGTGLKHVDAARRLLNEPIRIAPDINELSKALKGTSRFSAI